jgi:hypothetical protein
MGRTVCTELQCLYKGDLYLTSVPVQGCTLPYLSVCTRVHFTLPQCLYKGELYFISVPVRGCTLPYLSACTRVHFTLPQCLYEGALYLTSVPAQGCTLLTFDVGSSRCSITPTSYGTKQWNVTRKFALYIKDKSRFVLRSKWSRVRNCDREVCDFHGSPAGLARGDNTIQRMLDTQGHRHTLGICNNFCFATATLVPRTRLVALCIVLLIRHF